METTTDTRGTVHPVYGPGFHTKVGGVPLSVGGKRVAGALVPLHRSGAPAPAAVTSPAVEAVRHRELTASELSPPLATMAAAVFGKVAESLGLSGIRLQWYCTEHAVDREERLRHKAARSPEPWRSWEVTAAEAAWKGFFREATPDVVFLKGTRDPWTVVEIVAHELRHAWQHRNAPSMTPAAREKDADDFASTIVSWYRSPPPAVRVPMPFYAP